MRRKFDRAVSGREVRSFPTELRAEGEAGARKIVGHAAVFNSLSEPMWGFREVVRPGAFTKTLGEGADVRAYWNHDRNIILGRRSSETLELSEDSDGLAMTITPPDTQTVRDLVLVPMERRDVREASFGFRVVKDAQTVERGENVRELLEVALFDVSPVSEPAYPAASIDMRSLDLSEELTEAYLEAFLAQLKLRGLTPAEISARFVPTGKEAPPPAQGGRGLGSLSRSLDLESVSV